MYRSGGVLDDAGYVEVNRLVRSLAALAKAQDDYRAREGRPCSELGEMSASGDDLGKLKQVQARGRTWRAKSMTSLNLAFAAPTVH